MKPFIWRGKSPFTIGQVDDNGKILESFTAMPGEEIPPKWLKIAKEAWTSGYEIDDKGKYSKELVEEHFRKLGKQ
jgi:hypothetical protein